VKVFQQLMAQSLNSNFQFFFGQDRLQSEYFYKNNETVRLLPKKDIHDR
jgi:hypothetical protein